MSNEGALANNEKFTAYFRENVSSLEVKGLINLIRLNNITAQSDRDGLGVIYIILNGTQQPETTALKAIKNGKRYTLNTPNDNKMTEDRFLKNNEYNAKNKDLSAAYYYNGFLRVISINELQESQINTQNAISK